MPQANALSRQYPADDEGDEQKDEYAQAKCGGPTRLQTILGPKSDDDGQNKGGLVDRSSQVHRSCPIFPRARINWNPCSGSRGASQDVAPWCKIGRQETSAYDQTNRDALLGIIYDGVLPSIAGAGSALSRRPVRYSRSVRMPFHVPLIAARRPVDVAADAPRGAMGVAAIRTLAEALPLGNIWGDRCS